MAQTTLLAHSLDNALLRLTTEVADIAIGGVLE